MYDPKTVSPMEDYRRRNAKAARIESKRDNLKIERERLREAYRVEQDSEKRAELFRTMVGLSDDMTTLHNEIIEVWRSR